MGEWKCALLSWVEKRERQVRKGRRLHDATMETVTRVRNLDFAARAKALRWKQNGERNQRALQLPAHETVKLWVGPQGLVKLYRFPNVI